MAGTKRRKHVGEKSTQCPATLGDLESEGVDMFCWCNRCSHNAIVPIGKLTGSLGPDQPVPEIGIRMRCTVCGAKDVAARPSWPSLGQVSNHS